MTFSEISNILDDVVTQWLDSIDNEELRNTFAENVLVAGGSIGSLIRNETPNDYDLFFRNQETVNLISNYYQQYDNSGNFRIITITENAVTFENGIQLVLKPRARFGDNSDFRHTKIGFDYRIITTTENAVTFENGIQLVLKYSGDLKQLWNNFDFRHTKIGFDYRTKQIQYDNQAVLDSINNKQLFYEAFNRDLKNLDLTLKRAIKLINRGWGINRPSYLILLKQYSEKGGDLNKYKELTTFIIQNDV